MDRISLEKDILSAEHNLYEDEKHEHLNKQGVETYLKAWRQLVAYYKKNADDSISVEMVREYIEWIDLFGTIWHNEKRSAASREIASEACSELRLYMNDIIESVDNRIYPEGRD
jgi:hypothetical protein